MPQRPKPPARIVDPSETSWVASRAFFQTFFSIGPGVAVLAAAVAAEKANCGLTRSC